MISEHLPSILISFWDQLQICWEIHTRQTLLHALILVVNNVINISPVHASDCQHAQINVETENATLNKTLIAGKALNSL